MNKLRKTKKKIIFYCILIATFSNCMAQDNSHILELTEVKKKWFHLEVNYQVSNISDSGSYILKVGMDDFCTRILILSIYSANYSEGFDLYPCNKLKNLSAKFVDDSNLVYLKSGEKHVGKLLVPVPWFVYLRMGKNFKLKMQIFISHVNIVDPPELFYEGNLEANKEVGN